MADVKINVQVDTKEAEAKLRALEARAARLNTMAFGGATGLPRQQVLGRTLVIGGLPDIGAARPGAHIFPDQSDLRSTKSTAHSNSMLMGQALAAGLVAGGIRNTRGTSQFVMDRSYVQDMMNTSPNELFKHGTFKDIRHWGTRSRFGSLGHSITAGIFLDKDARILKGGPLGHLLEQARESASVGGFRNAANRHIEASIRHQQNYWKASNAVWSRRFHQVSGGLFAEHNVLPGFLDKRVDKLGSLGSAVKGRLPIPIIGAVGLAVGASGSGKALGEAFRRQGVMQALRDARYRDIEAVGGMKTANLTAGIIGERAGGAFNSFVQWFTGGVFDIGTVTAVVSGEYDLARMRLDTADLLSGRFKDRHDKLAIMQNAWSRGFDAALDSAGRFSRNQSVATAMRAVEIGLRGGDMLNMDHRIYDEIQQKVKSRYVREYINKVPYPKMADIDGEKD